MSEQYQTTMKSLLTDAKRVLVDKSNQKDSALGEVKTFKRGVLPPVPWFPAVALLPVNETVERVYSGGKYVVRRELSFDVWCRSYKFKEAEKDCIRVLTDARDVLEDNYKLPGSDGNETTVDIWFGTQELADAEPFQKGFLQSATMRIAFSSQEDVPSARKIVVDLKQNTPKEMLSLIFNTVKEYGGSLLSDVVKFHEVAVPPIPLFPAVAVVEADVAGSHYETGRDESSRRFMLWVWTKLLDKEVNLDRNLDVVEMVKDVVQIEYRWGGYAKDTVLNNIAYGQMPLDNYSVYATGVEIDVLCARTL